MGGVVRENEGGLCSTFETLPICSKLLNIAILKTFAMFFSNNWAPESLIHWKFSNITLKLCFSNNYVRVRFECRPILEFSRGIPARTIGKFERFVQNSQDIILKNTFLEQRLRGLSLVCPSWQHDVATIFV